MGGEDENGGLLSPWTEWSPRWWAMWLEVKGTSWSVPAAAELAGKCLLTAASPGPASPEVWSRPHSPSRIYA